MAYNSGCDLYLYTNLFEGYIRKFGLTYLEPDFFTPASENLANQAIFVSEKLVNIWQTF